ncbi:hypothetical protein [Candidatus Soleaferrea massiliensis]|uniref:hypothetical protein n=1 Tax=Candidatus Soleaferrea massiliensis TaxID=1470354 RepID=UPI00058F2850|nr:hypothetical protein [Candidatus Soleaferrea massiliensis]
MTERMQLIFSLSCSLFLFLYFMIQGKLLKRSRKARLIARARQSGRIAYGICQSALLRADHTAANACGDRSSRCKATYLYEVNGQQYRKKLVFRSPHAERLRCPEKITLYYAKGNPAEAYSKEEAERLKPVQAECCRAAAFCAIMAILVYRMLKLVLIVR